MNCQQRENSKLLNWQNAHSHLFHRTRIVRPVLLNHVMDTWKTTMD